MEIPVGNSPNRNGQPEFLNSKFAMMILEILIAFPILMVSGELYPDCRTKCRRPWGHEKPLTGEKPSPRPKEE